MSRFKLKWPGAAWRPYTLAIAATVCATACSASAQEAMEAEAARLLAAMSNNLKSMPTLSANYDADQEIVDLKGQKIQYSASGTIALDRSKGFRMTRKGPFADAEVIFDGKTISLHGKELNVYAQLESPGTSVEEAAEELRASTGLDAPGADLLASDPFCRPH